MIDLPAADTLHYRGHHTLGSACTQLDGYLETADGTRRQLDVLATGDSDIRSDDITAAHAAYADGRIHIGAADVYGVATLVVPADTLTAAAISDALRRLFAQQRRTGELLVDVADDDSPHERILL